MNYNQSDVIEVDGENYLVQGRIDDPLTMMRPVNNLLACEKQPVAEILEEANGETA